METMCGTLKMKKGKRDCDNVLILKGMLFVKTFYDRDLVVS